MDVRAEIAGLKHRVATLETMTHAQGHSGQAVPTVTIRSVIDAAVDVFGIGAPWLLSTLRRRDIVAARQAAMYLAWRLTACSLPQIGRAFRRDHTTVLYAIRKMSAREREDQDLAARLQAVVARIPNAQPLREISA